MEVLFQNTHTPLLKAEVQCFVFNFSVTLTLFWYIHAPILYFQAKLLELGYDM